MYNYEKEVTEIIAAGKRPDKNIILDHKGRTVIYGAGNTGRRVLALLKRYGMRVDYFLDEKAGSDFYIDDIPVVRPDDSRLDRAANVIVALFNQTANTVSVIYFLQKLGFTKMLPYTELFLHFYDELPAQFWLAPADAYEPYIAQIAAALSMFKDRTSRQLFTSFLKFRVTGNPAYMLQPRMEDIYFPADIPGRTKPEHFIDCGAFDGDTLRLFRKRFGILESVRAFEPDSDNYQKLTQSNRETHFSKDTLLFPCAVWSGAVQGNFVSDGISSYISEQGNNRVQCVALDEYLDGYKPTLIKMDIEGSELQALQGCKKMITSVKPDLAVSIYHKPEHLWEVPLLVKKLTQDYKYYLRLHGFNGYETVFYANYEREGK